MESLGLIGARTHRGLPRRVEFFVLPG